MLNGRKPAPKSSEPEPERLTVTLRKTIVVTFGPGLQVLNIVTGFESSYVLVGNLPLNVTEEDIQRIARRYGSLLSTQLSSTEEGLQHKSQRYLSKRTAKIQYADSGQAACAVAGLNGEEHYSSKITAKLYFKGTRPVGHFISSLVRMELPVPGRIAYAGYMAKADAERVVASVHGTPPKGQDRQGMFSPVSAQMYEGSPKLGNYMVRFEGLPPDASERQVSVLGGCKAEGVMLERPKYHSLMNAVTILRRIMEEHGSVISVQPPTSPPKDNRIRCHVLFSTPAGAAAACAELNGKCFAFLARERVLLDHLYSIKYLVSSDIYRAVEQDLCELQAYARHLPGVQLVVYKKLGLYEQNIELCGTQLHLMKKVKSPLERLITGERVVDKHGKPIYDPFFSSANGSEFINNISRNSQVYIRVSGVRGEITLWGSPSCCTLARQCIVDELARLNARRCYSLPLNAGLVTHLIDKGLTDIEAKVHKENVLFDFVRRRLSIRGTEDQFNWVVQYLNELSATSPALRKHIVRRSKDKAEPCPVCLDFLIDSVTLNCGHQVCRGCLRRYLETAGDHNMFPLRCLGNNGTCEELLPLNVCRKLVSKELFHSLLESSFGTFVQSRPDEYFYCPTPDCPQVYRLVGPAGSVLQCPECLICICSSCHKEQHEGEQCAEISEENDRLFREWKEVHGVKQCPRCTSELQKIAGCNHVTCARCSTHICWQCMLTFQSSSEVYDHMKSEHNGIGY